MQDICQQRDACIVCVIVDSSGCVERGGGGGGGGTWKCKRKRTRKGERLVALGGEEAGQGEEAGEVQEGEEQEGKDMVASHQVLFHGVL